MPAALVHDPASETRVYKSIVAAIGRVLPHAVIVPLDSEHPCLQARVYTGASVRGRSIADFDLVISASLHAAARFPVSKGTPHLCLAGPETWSRQASITLNIEHPELPKRDSGSLRRTGLPTHPGRVAPPGFPISDELPGARTRLPARSAVLEQARRQARAARGECIGDAGPTLIIAASAAVQARLALSCTIPSVVLAPPVATEFYRPSPIRREAFYLAIQRGLSFEPIERAANACRQLNRSLVVIGGAAPDRSEMRRWPHVRHLGAQPPEVLRDHYRRCRGVLFPDASEFEPALIEAQACGAPVIALHQGDAISLVRDAEGAGQGTGLFFHEPTSWSLASAMQELERRPHKCDPGLAVANALRFSTSRFECGLAALIAAAATAQRIDEHRPIEHKSAA